MTPPIATMSPQGSTAQPSRSLAAGLLLFASATVALAQNPSHSLESVDEAPTLPDWAAPLIAEKGWRLIGPAGNALFEVWLREALPASVERQELGVEYGDLPSGALIGVVRVIDQWQDYKKHRIAAGLYTLRYAIQPADGDHTGETYYRDFLLLLPIETDVFQIDGAEIDPLVEASQGAAQANHPAVMGLYPIAGEVPDTSLVSNELGEPMLVIRLGGRLLGLVVEGHGEDNALNLQHHRSDPQATQSAD